MLDRIWSLIISHLIRFWIWYVDLSLTTLCATGVIISNRSAALLKGWIICIYSGCQYEIAHRLKIRVDDVCCILTSRKENIVIASDGTPMINDFGCARMEHATLTIAALASQLKDTCNYWAPELLTGVNHLKESDVWAFGMTVYVSTKGSHAPLNMIINNLIFLPVSSNGCDPIWPFVAFHGSSGYHECHITWVPIGNLFL